MPDPREIEQTRIVRANVWLHRSRQDLEAVNGMMRSGRRRAGCQADGLPPDPALAVGLLCQSIEKAVKALLIAAGWDEGRVGWDFRHASLAADLALVRHLAEMPLSRKMLKIIDAMPGYSGVPWPDAMRTAERLQGQTGIRSREVSVVNELAALSADVLGRMCDGLVSVRDVVTEGIGGALRSRETVIDVAGLVRGLDAVQLGRLIETIAGRPFAEGHADTLLKLLDVMFEELPQGAREEALNSPPIRIGRDERAKHRKSLTENFYASWAQLALLIMAGLTFPHAVSSRYPSAPGAPDDPLEAANTGQLGSDHYRPPLGIVAALPSVYRLARLSIDSLGPAVEATAYFVSMRAPEATEEW